MVGSSRGGGGGGIEFHNSKTCMHQWELKTRSKFKSKYSLE